jgi:hypothetical protein
MSWRTDDTTSRSLCISMEGGGVEIGWPSPTSEVTPAGRCWWRGSLFAWLISHQPAVLFSQNKPATSNQPAVLFSQNKPAPAISHQPTEQAEICWRGRHAWSPSCCSFLVLHIFLCIKAGKARVGLGLIS